MPEIIYERYSDKRTLYLPKVIKLLEEGRSKASISRELPITRNTIDNWLKQISRKSTGGNSSDGNQMKSKKSKDKSNGKQTVPEKPIVATATTDSGIFAVTLNNPLGSIPAKVIEPPTFLMEADFIEDSDEEAISTKGLSTEELENLVKDLNRKLRKEKRRADRESANVEAMQELIGTAERTFKIDILKKSVAKR